MANDDNNSNDLLLKFFSWLSQRFLVKRYESDFDFTNLSVHGIKDKLLVQWWERPQTRTILGGNDLKMDKTSEYFVPWSLWPLTWKIKNSLQ